MLSVVIPVKDEAESIPMLASEIEDALGGVSIAWECIWVDDGSSDGTAVELERLANRMPQHRWIRHDRSYGQSAALSTGFSHARGGIIATLDGDGQNPPAEIPRILERLIGDDLDMVCGYRVRRYSLVRLLSSRIANGFRNAVTGDSIRDVGCSLRAFRAGCVAGLFLFRGTHRFLPTLVRMNGYERIVEVPVEHRPRTKGRTKYGIHNRLWVGIADTLAVRWMSKRKVEPKVIAYSSPSAHAHGAASKETIE